MSSLFWDECGSSLINLPLFNSKPFSYSTRVSEYYVLIIKWYFRFRIDLNWFIFDTIYIFIFLWAWSDSVRVDFVERYWFERVVFVKFYHSCMNFSDLKCGTSVFREPNYGCLCLRRGIAISLIVFSRQADSLTQYCIIF